ncbi:MAG: hypothetical protein K0S78_4319 [Thermomicrobiales bacterium]|nr:hypothetical protein [Thermomicrobiales bacterium]
MGLASQAYSGWLLMYVAKNGSYADGVSCMIRYRHSRLSSRNPRRLLSNEQVLRCGKFLLSAGDSGLVQLCLTGLDPLVVDRAEGGDTDVRVAAEFSAVGDEDHPPRDAH